MGEEIRGMVVYHRTTLKRGKVTASNQFTGLIAIQYDDGEKNFAHVSELMSEQVYQDLEQEKREKEMALKPEHAVIGATVYRTGSTAPLKKGKVAAPPSNDVVIVEFDDGALLKVALKHLLSEVDGIAENQRLYDEQNRLEREFEEAQAEVEEKLSAAAKLINEAAAIADRRNVSIMDMSDATYELECAMDNAGWSTSSWHC